MEAAEILDVLGRLKATATVGNGELRLKYPKSATAKIQALGPEIKRRKSEILRLVTISEAKSAQDRILDGHQVVRVIWETNNAVIFRDEAGCFWRYLYAYRQAWPVIIGGMQDCNPGAENKG
jgi:hypothetical protein